MANRATKKAAAKKPAAKRELIAPRGDKRYIRRDARGRIKESEDRRRKAKKTAKTARGDRGDRKPALKTKAGKKIACQELVTHSTFPETTRFLKDSPIRPNS